MERIAHRIINKRILGRTRISVSELCLGTMNFGWTVDREAAFTLLDAYRDSGGCFLQSINICPKLTVLPQAMKAPEEWVGDWLRSRAVPRDHVVLSTRLNFAANKDSGLTGMDGVIRKCCEASLQRIGVSYLDLLVCEWTRNLIPIDDTLMAFNHLIEAGLLRHVAIANAPLWRLMEANCRSFVRNTQRFEALQTNYSVLKTPTVREETRDFCQSYRIGLLATSTLGRRPINHRRRNKPGVPTANQECENHTLKSLRKAAILQGATDEQAALVWVLSHQHVSSVIISPGTTKQLSELIDAGSWLRSDGFDGELSMTNSKA